MANVVFKKCSLFLKTLRTHPEAQKPLNQFIQHKSVSPTEPFGGKDYPYTAGALKGILHSKLGKDLRILYTISGKETKVIYLIGVFTTPKQEQKWAILALANKIELLRKLLIKISNLRSCSGGC